MQRLKKLLVKTPVLGYLLLISKEMINHPRTLHVLRHTAHNLNTSADATRSRQIHANEKILDILADNHSLQESQKKLHNELLSLKLSISSINMKRAGKIVAKDKHNVHATELFADDHRLDDFYLQFENRFRGDEKTIIKRLEVYLPYFLDRSKHLNAKPVLDIGSGRGEFLELLSNNGISVRGLDINKEMVERSKSKGFDTVESDVQSYLIKQKENTFSAICGFHIVEHIPFPELMSLFSECYRTLEKGGTIIFETPNPENLTVGSLNFYYDPSHLKPLPPQLLAFCLEHVGFTDIEILPLHPEAEINHDEKMISEALKRIFGPRDYAVIAKKR